jgi:hypothetical protein
MLPNFEPIAGPQWDDLPTVIVGAGPSLIGKSLEPLRGKAHVVAVTSALWDLPWADVGFGVDYDELLNWWERFKESPLPIWWVINRSRMGYKLPMGVSDNLHFMKMMSGVQLSDDPWHVCGGGTSGFGALNFAWLKGARKVILLLGFDYRSDAAGNWHYKESAYGRELHYRAELWQQWAEYFSYIAGQLEAFGVKVLNGSPASEIRCFPRVTVEEGIERVLQGC